MMIDNVSAPARVSVPLATLLDHDVFAANVLAPRAAQTTGSQHQARFRRVPIAATIVVDLPNPSRYTQQGDLLLITGLGLPSGYAETLEYVTNLQNKGVSALAFGVEPVYSSTPERLILACEEVGFPLIELPPQVHFASITMHFNRALETERTKTLASVNTLARRLTEATLQHRPAQRLVEQLATNESSWAVLWVGEEIYRGGATPQAEQLSIVHQELRNRLRVQPKTRGSLPTMFTTIELDGVSWEISAYETSPERPGSRASDSDAILAVARSERLTRTDLTALQLAANLVGLILQLPAAQSMSVDQLLMQLLIETDGNRLLGGERERFRRLFSHSLGGGIKQAYALVAIRNVRPSTAADPAIPANGTVASDVNWLRRVLRTPLVEHRDTQLRAFIRHPPTEAELASAKKLGWLFAFSKPHDLTELPVAMKEATELARTAGHLGDHVDGAAPPEDSPWTLLTTSDPFMVKNLAAQWLAPLLPEEEADVRNALISWLRNHGSWDRSARELGVHRNTLRRLISVAQQRLQRDLEDPLERARILLALDTLSSHRMGEPLLTPPRSRK